MKRNYLNTAFLFSANTCTDTCDSNAVCVGDSSSGFNCQCNSGFTGDGLACTGTMIIFLFYVINMN